MCLRGPPFDLLRELCVPVSKAAGCEGRTRRCLPSRLWFPNPSGPNEFAPKTLSPHTHVGGCLRSALLRMKRKTKWRAMDWLKNRLPAKSVHDNGLCRYRLLRVQAQSRRGAFDVNDRSQCGGRRKAPMASVTAGRSRSNRAKPCPCPSARSAIPGPGCPCDTRRCAARSSSRRHRRSAYRRRGPCSSRSTTT